jgi:hypothetical protein
MPRARPLSIWLAVAVTVIVSCGSFVSVSRASPGPEPLAYDAPESSPDTQGASFVFPLLGILLIGGAGVGVHTWRQDKRRVRGMMPLNMTRLG